MDVEDAALQLREDGGVESLLDLSLEGLTRGEGHLGEGGGGGARELAVEGVELLVGLLGKDQRGCGIEGRGAACSLDGVDGFTDSSGVGIEALGGVVNGVLEGKIGAVIDQVKAKGGNG